MTNVNMDEICKGCKEYEQYVEDPDTYIECEGFIKEDTECPCINCLIKTMCEYPCSLFRKRPWVKVNKT